MKEILIKLREENRYTQTAMAKLLGISRQSYMKYENGEVEPPVEVIRKLKSIYNVSYDVLIDNQIDFNTINYKSGNQDISYDNMSLSSAYSANMVASPTPAYVAEKSYSTEATKNTIKNSSLEEFATMLFSVAASLQTADLTWEEKLTKFQVYAKLAEAEMEIANGDKGEDIDTCFSKIMGEKWSKKYIK